MVEGKSYNGASVGLIVAVATVSGFVFDCDSRAINGTQDGLRYTFENMVG